MKTVKFGDLNHGDTFILTRYDGSKDECVKEDFSCPQYDEYFCAVGNKGFYEIDDNTLVEVESKYKYWLVDDWGNVYQFVNKKDKSAFINEKGGNYTNFDHYPTANELNEICNKAYEWD